jgi:hypothetical protein
MFLIRTAFFLGLVIMLLPTDKATQIRLSRATGGALDQALTFCDRNAATCEKGAEAWAVFKSKAEFGGRLALDLLNTHALGGATPAEAPRAFAPYAGEPPLRQPGTLRKEDRLPAWRGDGASR